MGAEESVLSQDNAQCPHEKENVEFCSENGKESTGNLQKSGEDFTLLIDNEADGGDSGFRIESYDFLEDLEVRNFGEDGDIELRCGQCDFDMVKSIVTKLSGRRGIKVNFSDVFQTVDDGYRSSGFELIEDLESSESEREVDDGYIDYECMYNKRQRKCKKMKKVKVNRARKELNLKRASSSKSTGAVGVEAKPGKWLISSRNFRKLGLHEINNNESVGDWVSRSRGPGGVDGVHKNVALLRAIGAGGARELSLKLLIRNSEKAKDSENLADDLNSEDEDFVMIK